MLKKCSSISNQRHVPVSKTMQNNTSSSDSTDMLIFGDPANCNLPNT